jgi:hypothetical protein
MGLVLLASLTASAAADNFHAVLKTSGVMANFEGTTADGCVQVSGVFFTDLSDQGPLGELFGSATDSCTGGDPVTAAIFGFGDAAYTSNGLGSASASGTIVTFSAGSIAPLTFEYSLTFSGTGATQTQQQHGHFVSTGPDGNVTMSFSSSRRRAAIVSGSITVDGGAVTLTDTFLGAGISGDLSVVR